MITRQLIRTDLNLLVVLQVLLEERNVTRAAERLFVSQPALSKTLQKLRDTFDDELFTRTAHGLVPTPRAEQLGKHLPEVLEKLDAVLGDEAFSPETFEGTFHVLLPPMYAEILLPGLMAELALVAPAVEVITGDVTQDYQDRLKTADIDFAIYVVLDTHMDVHAEPIRTITPRCYMRVDHPLADKKMNLEDFLNYPHVRLYLPGLTRESSGLVDEVLSEFGVHRRVSLETTQFAPTVGVLAQTDSLMVANAGLVDSGYFDQHVVGRPLPDELMRMMKNHTGSQRLKLALLRHARTAKSPSHRWFRGLLMKHLSRAEAAG